MKKIPTKLTKKIINLIIATKYVLVSQIAAMLRLKKL